MSESLKSGAEALLSALHTELERACAASDGSGPKMGATAARLVDTLRQTDATERTIRRAEGILLDLQRVEMSKRAGDGRHRTLLVSCRDGARMLVADFRRGIAFEAGA